MSSNKPVHFTADGIQAVCADAMASSLAFDPEDAAIRMQARPPLRAGEYVWAYDGPVRGVLPEDCRPVQLEPGEGPWYPVPVEAVEEPPASGSTSTFTEGNHL